MNDSAIARIAKIATQLTKRDSALPCQCVWDGKDRCIIYTFSSDADAENFMRWKRIPDSPIRLEKQHVSNSHVVYVKEYWG